MGWLVSGLPDNCGDDVLEIGRGSWPDESSERRGHRLLVVVLVLVGLVVGASIEGLPPPGPASSISPAALAATLIHVPPFEPETADGHPLAVLMVYNLDERPVAVHDARLRFAGFGVDEPVWRTAPYPPLTVPGRGMRGIDTRLVARCWQHVERYGRVRFTTSGPRRGAPETPVRVRVFVDPVLREHYATACAALTAPPRGAVSTE
jgi:hypothetical protein